MIFDNPTKAEYDRLIKDFPFDDSILDESIFKYSVHRENSFEALHSGQQLITWNNHLRNRMYQTSWSWLYLTYFFDKGIPDERTFISPGPGGSSIKHLPDFEKNHHTIKAQFDYFADVFYFKFFSAWDTLGHILNFMYDLGIKKVDFRKAVAELKPIRPDLYKSLNGLLNSEVFRKMTEFRHSSTHNELIGHFGSAVTKASENEYSIGVGKYTSAAEIKANADSSLQLFRTALEFMKEQVQYDLKS